MLFFFDIAEATPRDARALETVIETVAAHTVPAVVHIRVDKGRRICSPLIELEDRYGAVSTSQSGPWSKSSIVREATGSGVIIDPSGRIYTNHHVVEGAVEVKVILSDQRMLSAKVIGADPRTDIALLQIDAPGPFPSLTLGSSQDLNIGSLVIAVGNPFDFQSTVTWGIVSARGRRGLTSGEIQDYIQTDAAINPGNSGGALVDLDGRLVGINTAIYAPAADQNAGISFAIPVEMAERVTQELAIGAPRRSWLGVVVEDATAVEGYPSQRGAEILQILPGSPAEKAGLRKGDVLLAISGEPISGARSVQAVIPSRPVGKPVLFQILRDQRIFEASIILADAKERGNAGIRVPPYASWWRGMAIVDAEPAILSQLGLPNQPGLVVIDVLADSDAARIGLVAGDRIVGIGGKPIVHLDELRVLLATPGWISLRFERHGVTTTTWLLR